MIERVYLKEYITFDEVELEFSEVEMEFSKGLIVFTGPSGAGKSVLLRGILSIFGFFDVNAKLAEAIVAKKIDLSEYGIDIDDEIIFKQMKKNKTRYFINNQAVSKKIVKEIASKFISYLSLREVEELKNENILNVLDKMVEDPNYQELIKDFKEKFFTYKKLLNKLNEITSKEKEAKERIEFLKYDLAKIEEINPKEEEFEELMKIKKDLSKLEKIKEKIYEIEEIFNFESSVYEFLNMIDYEDDFFTNAMNELRLTLDKAAQKASFLENVNVEDVLDRLSKLQELIIRFGSIKEALISAKLL